MRVHRCACWSVIAFMVCAAAGCADRHMGRGVSPPGTPKSMRASALERGARAIQGQDPVQGLSLYLVGFHVHKDDPQHQMITHHFCHMVNHDLHQCVLFDGNGTDANLTGIEYVISEDLYNRLPPDERRYWHPHNYEVFSGTLIAPKLPDPAEQDVMRMLINSYGKTWHTWQTGLRDRSQDRLPRGPAELGWSFNHDGEAKADLVESRDEAMGLNTEAKRRQRQELLPLAHPQEGVNTLLGKFGGPVESIRGVQAKENED